MSGLFSTCFSKNLLVYDMAILLGEISKMLKSGKILRFLFRYKLRNNSCYSNKALPNQLPASKSYVKPQRGDFFQEAPRLENYFVGDASLKSYLTRLLPEEVR